MKKNIGKTLRDIESEFFELDHEKKLVFMRLEFAKSSDIMDTNAITKIPVLSDDFIEWIIAAFQYAPRGYRIDLDISFDDLEGYQEDDLKDVFFKNMLLEAKRHMKDTLKKNHIAFGLIAIGSILLISMILLLGLWQDGGIAKEIISYIFDIATTVTFWEAMTILIVETKQKRDLCFDFIHRFGGIAFHKK